MLIRRRLVGIGLFPTRQIPDLEAAAISHQGYFAFEIEFLAKVFGQDEAALSVTHTVFSPSMQLAEKHPPVASRYLGVSFSGCGHTRKFLRRHDHEKLVRRFRKNDEF